MTRLLDTVPDFYLPFLPGFFRQPVTHEEKATCASCAMCESSCNNAVRAIDGESRFFRPDTKCCTYHPRLANYLVGAILSDESPDMAEGRRRVEERIAGRVGITPMWLKAPPRYSLLYGHQRRAFGRNTTLLCPFYAREDGRCTVWRYRESVCSTYFCKYVEGEDGFRFWMSLKEFLTLLEVQLSRYALRELFPEFLYTRKDRPDPNAHLLGPAELDDAPPDDRAYGALWGEWRGREVEFYRTCYDRVRALTREDVERLLGFDGQVEQAVVERALIRKHSTTLPRFLSLNAAATVKWLPDGSVALGAYSENDALALPRIAWELLISFTGEAPVEEVRRRWRDERQADLSDEILIELHRHRVLIEATPPEAP